ncbi:hypothetical protein Dtur_0504 [Dictyoglomus turgidum DSM 6724]|uniref:Uncharacterized protein n=1 Tax=Dictyoglomus turgidum (strain DSM 6724 / Z-1310) TaxID=515635 RepID=B8E214_DICTD|nr:hypothetical protein Dtur_0504 [Dictyoglomus turgidum DSM 6724]PNV78975.1 MAG: hypothetical protein C0196_07430 [Dictyoglomus turgidum]HBU31351.1 hypothetical protein [Dictyoglomus sp.]
MKRVLLILLILIVSLVFVSPSAEVVVIKYAQ